MRAMTVNSPVLRVAAAQAESSLRAVSGGIGGMNQPNHGVAGDRRLDLAKAADEAARLAGQRQSAEGSGQEQPLDASARPGSTPPSRLKAAGEHVALDRFDNRGPAP